MPAISPQTQVASQESKPLLSTYRTQALWESGVHSGDTEIVTLILVLLYRNTAWEPICYKISVPHKSCNSDLLLTSIHEEQFKFMLNSTEPCGLPYKDISQEEIIKASISMAFP